MNGFCIRIYSKCVNVRTYTCRYEYMSAHIYIYTNLTEFFSYSHIHKICGYARVYMWMYIRTSVDIYTYIQMWMDSYTGSSPYCLRRIHSRLYICIYVHTCVYIHPHVYMRICNTCMRSSPYVYMWMYTCGCIYTQVCTYTHTYKCECILTWDHLRIA